MNRLTREDVREWVGRIANQSHDDEAAHTLEDELREHVLRAIADGTCEDPKGCAEEALKSNNIKFERWCA